MKLDNCFRFEFPQEKISLVLIIRQEIFVLFRYHQQRYVQHEESDVTRENLIFPVKKKIPCLLSMTDFFLFCFSKAPVPLFFFNRSHPRNDRSCEKTVVYEWKIASLTVGSKKEA